MNRTSIVRPFEACRASRPACTILLLTISQSMVPVRQVALIPLVPFSFRRYILQIFLPFIYRANYRWFFACFIVYKEWILHVSNTIKAIFFSYPILYRAIRAKTRPFPVFTRYRTNSDFFGSPIRTANNLHSKKTRLSGIQQCIINSCFIHNINKQKFNHF